MFSPKAIKVVIIVSFFLFALIFGLTGDAIAPNVGASSNGAPAGFTGAPDENDCRACHSGSGNPGPFVINTPRVYFPGRTYRITVTHTNPDTTRKRWGFQMTALAGINGAGTFANLDSNTQVESANGRNYVNHTRVGTFENQTGGATWAFNWTAPATEVGNVSIYAAGNQANFDRTTDGDLIVFAQSVVRPQPGFVDFDGDRKTDTSISRVNGPVREWWWVKSGDLSVPAVTFGVESDIITPADFTGDGKADVAIFRPSNGTWYVLRSEDLNFLAFPFGIATDIPAAGDYDGDGKFDAGVFRPSQATWYVNQSNGGFLIRSFGAASDRPLPSAFIP